MIDWLIDWFWVDVYVSTVCILYLNCVLYISQLCALYFSTVCFIFIFLNYVHCISNLCALYLYISTVCFIFLNCVLYISQLCALYFSTVCFLCVSTVTQIRKAYRIFPIHFLFTCWKNWFFLRCMPFLICLFFIRSIRCVYVAASRVYLLGMSILCYCYLPVIF